MTHFLHCPRNLTAYRQKKNKNHRGEFRNEKICIERKCLLGVTRSQKDKSLSDFPTKAPPNYPIPLLWFQEKFMGQPGMFKLVQ